MNTKIKEAKDAARFHIEQIQKLKEELVALFAQTLRQYILDNDIKEIVISVNNHDFNDGDTTYFRFYHNDLEVEFKEEKNKDWSGAITAELKSFFKVFDYGDFYESLFSDAYESVTITETTKF